MAGTLKFTMKIEHLHDDLDLSFKQKTFSIGQTIQGGQRRIQVIGTSPENLDVGDVTPLGIVYIWNLHATAVVTFGPDSTGIVEAIEIRPGECWPFRLIDGETYLLQSTVASTKVQIGLFAD